MTPVSPFKAAASTMSGHANKHSSIKRVYWTSLALCLLFPGLFGRLFRDLSNVKSCWTHMDGAHKGVKRNTLGLRVHPDAMAPNNNPLPIHLRSGSCQLVHNLNRPCGYLYHNSFLLPHVLLFPPGPHLGVSIDLLDPFTLLDTQVLYTSRSCPGFARNTVVNFPVLAMRLSNDMTKIDR